MKGAALHSGALAYSVATPIPWAYADFDYGGFFSYSDLTRLTVPSGVDYVSVRAHVAFNNVSELHSVIVTIRKNGSEIEQLRTSVRPGATPLARAGASYVPVCAVSAGDYFDVVYTYTGATAPTQMIATGSAGIELVDLTGFAGCLARRDTSDATSLSWPVEPLPYNTDVIDTASYFNTSTGEITIPSGVSAVEVWAGVRTPDDALAGSNVLTIEKNGTTVPALRTHTRQGTTGTATNYAATVVPYLAVSNGDVLHARLAQTDLSTTESLLDDFGSIFGCRVIPSVFSPIATYTNAFLHTGRTWAAATTGWNGYTIRRVITQIDLLRGGSKFQLKVKGPTTAANTVIGSCYIGRRNEIYGFREAPTQITFNTGSSGVTLGQNAEVTSDEITYEINPREEYIISFYISGVSSISAITVSSTTGHGGAYYKAAVNEPTTQAPTGYTAATTNAYIISGLDVY